MGRLGGIQAQGDCGAGEEGGHGPGCLSLVWGLLTDPESRPSPPAAWSATLPSLVFTTVAKHPTRAISPHLRAVLSYRERAGRRQSWAWHPGLHSTRPLPFPQHLCSPWQSVFPFPSGPLFASPSPGPRPSLPHISAALTLSHFLACKPVLCAPILLTPGQGRCTESFPSSRREAKVQTPAPHLLAVGPALACL